MNEEIYFSMIVYVDDEDLLEKSLSSIIDVTPLVKSKIKLIVADSIVSDETKAVCDNIGKELGQKQFVYLSMKDANIGEAYNKALKYTEGRYANFSLASTYFEPKTLDIIYSIAEDIERPKLLCLSPWTVNEKGEYVQYKMSPAKENKPYIEVSLHDTPEKLHLMFHAYFIRCYLLRSEERTMQFKPELLEEAPLELLCNLLAEFMGYTYLSNLIFNYTKQLEDNTSAFMDQHYRWWYMDSFKNWIIPFAQKWNAEKYPLRNSMRMLLLYLVFARYNCNLNDRTKGVVERSDIPEMRMLTGKILQFVDNKIIFSKTSLQHFNIPRAMKIMFMEIKAEQMNCICEPIVSGGKLYIWTHKKYDEMTQKSLDRAKYIESATTDDIKAAGKELDMTSRMFTVSREDNDVPVLKWTREEESLLPVCELKKEHVILYAINYSKNCLKIDGLLSLGNFIDREKIKLYVYKDGKEYTKINPIDVYDLKKVFGVTYARDYRFYVEVPVFAVGNTSNIQFYVEINENRFPVEIRSGEVYSHVNEKVKNQYWHFDNNWCLSIANKNALKMEKVNAAAIKKKETAFENTLKTIKNPAAQKALQIRKQYFATMDEYEGRRIWITFDKLYKAGDNGEYMYDYISSHDDSIEMYYLIKSDSPDYQRMLDKGDNLLVWGEDETLIKALYAEVILDTHANAFSYMGFESAMKPYVGDLFNPKIVCIQHGLTVQNIAQFQNRLFDNTSMYLCASQNEIDNLSREIYGYVDKSILKLTGIARHDGLRSNDKKQILITPTWRRNIANSNVAHFKKGHNDYFKNSDYFKIYNKLVNDPTLIECAKKTGYKLIYLLHPAASAQIDDFDRNDYVEIIQAAGDMNYEKILTESSLMVTDFSGVQFDFGYMRKPILYYHPSELPPHYNESEAYKYQRDAFGPVVDNHDELVKQLCEYMRNGCKIKPEYKARGDKFFAYNDFGNCERIYKQIDNYLHE